MQPWAPGSYLHWQTTLICHIKQTLSGSSPWHLCCLHPGKLHRCSKRSPKLELFSRDPAGNGLRLRLNQGCASVGNCLSHLSSAASPELQMNVCQAHNERKHPFREETRIRGKLEKERDIKGQVFSIQEADRGSRSDKLLCKQPPQILPAGGSPSPCCFVYQSALTALRGHWSNDPYLYTPPPYTESQNRSDYPLPLPPVLPSPLPLFFPPAHSVFFFMCFKGLTLKTSLFTSSSSSLQTAFWETFFF